MVYMWLALMVILCIIEALTMQMICIWLAGGALAAAIASIAGLNQLWQIAIFLGTSVILLVATRPAVKKLTKNRTEKTNADRIIGKKVVITEGVDNIAGSGKTVINGVEWSVRSREMEKIDEGSVVTVDRIEGVKLIVK